MKRFINFTVAAVTVVTLLFGCGDKFTSTKNSYEKSDRANTKVSIDYYTVDSPKSSAATMMNNSINQFITSTLLQSDSYDTSKAKIDSIVELILKSKEQDTVVSHIPYQFIIKGEPLYNAKKVTAMKFDSYIYMGGANGLNTIKFLHFDKRTGLEVSIDKVINLDQGLLDKVRVEFCKLRKIDPDATAEEAQMFYAPSEIGFPKTIGLTENGVLFVYNLYEVAPRSFGKTEVIIPNNEVEFK